MLRTMLWCSFLTAKKRNAEDDVVVQFSHSEEENHDVQIQKLTDNADHAPVDMPGIADFLITTG